MTTHCVQQYKPGDFSLGQVHEFLGAFGRQGGTPGLLQTGIEDEKLIGSVICFWQSGGYEATTAQKIARAIMGEHYFGIEEATRHFGVKPTKAQLAALAEIPFTEVELQECRDTHILIAVFPLSILDIRKRVERKLFRSREDVWYNKEMFARTRGTAHWLLIRKTEVSNSISSTWEEQQALITEDEEVPTAQEMTYFIIGYYFKTKERLFEHINVRTADSNSNGTHILIGFFSRAGLCFSNDLDFRSYDSVGLASSRKFRN